ncbi:MAG: LysR family transcriptional regulator [Caulobacterales bacterium]|nr:LysR family transcriptional regulator [Caulobacterales bacterium]
MRHRHIEIFHAVMETGSVSAAAGRLGVTQPSVTKTLQQAEADLGYLLFDRVKGRLQPTEEARALALEVQRAHAALESVRQLGARLKHGVERQLRVAATPSLGLEALPEAVARYTAEHERARFEISTQHSGDLLASLGQISHGFDLGFTFGADGAPASVASVEIGRARLACVFRSGTMEEAGEVARMEDLRGRRVIGLNRSEPLGRLLADRTARLDPPADFSIQAQTHHLACALAARSQGVAIVDQFTTESFVGRGEDSDMRATHFEPEESLPVTAVFPLARGLPLAARGLVEAFRDVVAARANVTDRGAG